MLNIVLKNAGCMIYIPDEESVKEYLSSIVSYYETGSYELFKKYFIHSYQKVINMILEVELSKKNEMNSKSLHICTKDLALDSNRQGD